MRRLLLVFLLLTLPFQFSWAAAAGYCHHEAGGGTRHFGHHAHSPDTHQAGAHGDPGDLTLDDDCSFCHLGCAQPVPPQPPCAVVRLRAARVQPAPLPLLFESHIAPGPERPDRRVA